MAVARRSWPAAAAVLCATLFAWCLAAAVRDEEEGWSWVFVLGSPLGYLVLALSALAVLAVVARRFWPRAAAISPARTAAIVAIAGLLSTLPVSFGYDDGCNDHWTLSPLALTPALAIVRPERAVGAYGDGSTLMACFRGPPLVTPR